MCRLPGCPFQPLQSSLKTLCPLLGWLTCMAWAVPMGREAAPHKHMSTSDKNSQRMEKWSHTCAIWFPLFYTEWGSIPRGSRVLSPQFDHCVHTWYLVHIGPCRKTEAGTLWPVLALARGQRVSKAHMLKPQSLLGPPILASVFVARLYLSDCRTFKQIFTF